MQRKIKFTPTADRQLTALEHAPSSVALLAHEVHGEPVGRLGVRAPCCEGNSPLGHRLVEATSLL